MKQTLTRLALTLPVVWLVVSLVFLLIHLVPGDPVQMMLGEGASPTDISTLRHQLGLDLPLGTQYIHYWAGVLHGDLGTSIRLHDTVVHLIAQRYPYTLALTLAALVLALALALPAGIFAAVRRGRWADQLLSVVSALRAFRARHRAGSGADLDFFHQPRLAPGVGSKCGWFGCDRLALPYPARSRHGRFAGGDFDPHGTHGHA